MTEEQILLIAQICHQTNKAWCEANGDNSQKDWNQADEWQKDSAVLGVKFRLDNPDAPVHAQHDAWCIAKTQDGWRYGLLKNVEEKTHPCLVPFEQLPEIQQRKDKLFQAVVDALK